MSKEKINGKIEVDGSDRRRRRAEKLKRLLTDFKEAHPQVRKIWQAEIDLLEAEDKKDAD